MFLETVKKWYKNLACILTYGDTMDKRIKTAQKQISEKLKGAEKTEKKEFKGLLKEDKKLDAKRDMMAEKLKKKK